MANTGFKGIDVVQSGNQIVFDAFLLDSVNAALATGTTNLALLEEQSDGTFKTYDWSSNTFKTSGMTSSNSVAAMTHRTRITDADATVNLGIWTKVLSTLTDLTVGAKYLAVITNSAATPVQQVRKFQYGSADGDNITQTGDTYAIVNNVSYGNSALATLITNLKNNTSIRSTIPEVLERPDSGSKSIAMVFTFEDENGNAADLDSGNPSITIVNDDGTNLASRLASWTHPATGKYSIVYTSSATDTVEGVHWDVTATLNAKAKRFVEYMQIVDTTAVNFTSTDRTNLGLAVSQTTASAIRGAVGMSAANLDTTLAAISTAIAALPNSAAIITAIKAMTIDGVAFESVVEIWLAFLTGKITVADLGNNLSAYVAYKRDGTTPKYTLPSVSQITGARTTGIIA